MRFMNHLLLCCCMVTSLWMPWSVQACKCFPPTLVGAFENADVVLQATLLRRLRSIDPLTLAYSASIIRAWKGCEYYKGVQRTTITTSTSSAACGVQFLKLGIPYLFTGYLDETNTTLRIGTCSFQARWNSLNATEKKEVAILSNQYTNCTCPSPASCGPKKTRNFLCPDGITMAGPTTCSFDPNKAECTWDNKQCPACKEDADCAKGFCARGFCRAAGTCAKDYDCWNPSNTFDTGCPGLPLCRASKCFLNCKKPCPNGAPLVECVGAPCEFTKCAEPYVSCADNYCGGCNALFYNATGYQVCTRQ